MTMSVNYELLNEKTGENIDLRLYLGEVSLAWSTHKHYISAYIYYVIIVYNEPMLTTIMQTATIHPLLHQKLAEQQKDETYA